MFVCDGNELLHFLEVWSRGKNLTPCHLRLVFAGLGQRDDQLELVRRIGRLITIRSGSTISSVKYSFL